MYKCWVNIEQFKATQHKIRYWRTQQLFGLKGSLKTFCISLTIFQFNKVKRFSWCDTFNNLFSKENYCIIFWSFMQFCFLLENCVTLRSIVSTFWLIYILLDSLKQFRSALQDCQLQMQVILRPFLLRIWMWPRIIFHWNCWKNVRENLRRFSNEP